MKLSTRITALLLAITTIASFAACSKDTGNKIPDESKSGDSVTTAVETEDPTLRKNAKDNLPADLNFKDQTIRILYRDNGMIGQYDLVGTDNEGEIVTDAVHQRNRTVEERLGVVFDMIPSDKSDIGSVKSQITKFVSSSSDDYDVIVGTGNTLPQAGIGEYLMDLSDDPYLDYDQPWWWNDAMDELSFDINVRQFLIGDFLLFNLMSTGAIYMNKNLYENAYGDPNELYNKILAGNWTLDEMTNLVKGAYQDLNGSTTEDEDDLYGMLAYNSSGAYHFQYATDIPSYTRNDEGYPEFSAYDDRTVAFVDKMLAIYDLPGTRRVPEGDLYSLFSQDKALFMPYRLAASFSQELRNMKSDFGVIPYPKLDEMQEKYMTMIHDCSSDAAIPKTNSIMEATTASLEALCAEAYRSVTEKFYEVALKAKYVRDDVSSQMIDIIYESATKNFMAEYASLLGGIGHYVFTCVEQGNNTIASSYAKQITSATKALTRQIEKLQK